MNDCALSHGGQLEDAPGKKGKSVAKKSRKNAGEPQILNRYEEVNVAIEDIIQSVTEDYLKHFGVPANRLTTSERQQIVQELDRHGVFLVKGSIGEVAQRLGCSEVTIYRYLQQTT